jgi:hypothetical protein
MMRGQQSHRMSDLAEAVPGLVHHTRIERPRLG